MKVLLKITGSHGITFRDLKDSFTCCRRGSNQDDEPYYSLAATKLSKVALQKGLY